MMIDCAIIGDSIAVGLQHVMKECSINAESGINSINYVARLLKPTSASIVVISLGSNDYKDDLLPALQKVRSEIRGQKVFWLLPNVPRPANIAAVRSVALAYGDIILVTKPWVNSGKVHLTRAGYHAVATKIQEEFTATQN